MKCPHCKRDIRDKVISKAAAAIKARRARRGGEPAADAVIKKLRLVREYDNIPAEVGAEIAELERIAGSREAKTMNAEICSNTEWWRVYGLDFDGIDEAWKEEAARDFQRMLALALENAGHTVSFSRGKRASFGGWHWGAAFARKGDGIGTFDDVDEIVWEGVGTIRDDVETQWAAKWRDSHPDTKAMQP
jgi:hypothetical protein